MGDNLILPQVPEVKPEDPEDVSWALSTAEAMWARGDHAEGIKWVRRAAEAASEAERDARALELAKAAADLTGLVTRQTSRSSIDLEEIAPAADLEEIAPAAPPPVPPGRTGTTGKPPPKPAATAAPTSVATSVSKQVAAPSHPPPLAPRTSSAPPTPTAPSQAPKSKPLGTNTSKPPSIKPTPATAQRPVQGKKTSRKSRENLDGAARAATVATESTAQLSALDDSNMTTDTTETRAVQVPYRRGRAEIGSNDPTLAVHLNDLMKQGVTEDWASTSELPVADGDRKTVVGSPPADFTTTMQSFPRAGAKRGTGGSGSNTNPPATVAGAMLSHTGAGGPGARAMPSERHDPGIKTSQAVRVVVWRDANGVHVAPAGTVVSAITVDAMLVALEPGADLTAWLGAGNVSQPKR
jgi:hypothetical protein